MKALILHEQVVGIERRDIDVYEYYHEDIANLFIDCPDNTEIGDLYIEGKFVKPEDDGGATE
jgi:hypothetical protein